MTSSPMTSSSPFLLLFYLLLYLTQTDAGPDDVDIPTADCTPKDPLLQTGTSLQLSCTLNKTSEGVTARQVLCKFDAETFQVTVIDDSTFQVTRDNVTRQMSQGHIFCYINVSGKQWTVAQVVIRVADAPVSPKITECIVYNWSRMVCRWEESPDTGLPVNYTLAWTVIDDPPNNRCPSQHANTCEWTPGEKGRFMMGMKYRIKMTAENALKKVFTPVVRFDTDLLVKPNPVTELDYSIVTSYYVIVYWIWEDPNTHAERNLLFRITYKSKWDETSLVANTTDRNITLTNLVPNTDYNLSCDLIPKFNNNAAGFWSVKKNMTFKTPSTVPAQGPALMVGGFDKVNGNRVIEIYWQPVPEKLLQGPLEGFRITCRNTSGDVVARHEEETTEKNKQPYSYIMPQLFDYMDLICTVEMKTDKGYNDSLDLETLVIPSTELTPPAPEMFYAVGQKSELTAHWSSVSNATGYTVYWCKELVNMRCEASLSWESLPANVTNLTLPLGNATYKEFRVAVSVEQYAFDLQRTVSSGLVWAKCVRGAEKSPKVPSSFEFSLHQQPYNLSVQWVEPNCVETAYIMKYELLYCPRQRCGGKDCCHENQTMLVRNNETKATITGLEPDVEYLVYVRSVSVNGASEYSMPIKRVVQRSGLTNGAIAGIVVASILLLLLLTVGLATIVKKIKKCLNCCDEIKIVPPPAVVFSVNQNDLIESSPGYGVRMDMTNRLNEELTSLLGEDGRTGNYPYPTKPNAHGNGNCYSQTPENAAETFRLLPDSTFEIPSDSGIPPSNDSSISPYTHLAVPDESGCTGNISEIDSAIKEIPHYKTPAAANDAACYNFPAINPLATNSIPLDANSYMGVESLQSSSSIITPYTTIEQTVEQANEPVGFSEYREFSSDGVESIPVTSPIHPVSDDSEPSDLRNNSVGAYTVSCVTDFADAKVEDVTKPENVVSDSHSVHLDNVQIANGNELDDFNATNQKLSLPVGYIPLAPTLSS